MEYSDNKFMLHFTQANVSRQFIHLREYYNEISPMIIGQKQDLIAKNEKLQKDLENESEEARDQHYDLYFDDFYLIEMIEQTYCNSMIISIYTLIEKYLNEFCKRLKDIKNIPIKHSELRGDGVERAKIYINKLCELKFDQNDAEFLSGINAIRNVIAHENGELYNTDEKNINKILNISKKTSGCTVKQEDYIDESGNIKKIYQNIELEFAFVDYSLMQGVIVFKNLFEQFKNNVA